jgi:hypothetical protein
MEKPTQGNSSMTFMVPIAHFERKYMITRDGKIWHLGKQEWKNQTQLDNGYMKADFKMNGRYDQVLVHRLVALHFIPNPYGHPIVNHKDGVKHHNWEDNLEWTSEVGNAQHALETGLRAGFMSHTEKTSFVVRVLKGELIRDIAFEIGRKEESLSGMLRRHAQANGQSDLWNHEMKRRRKDVAIRNLEQINS